tara:strand:+ start:440 stop:592 length:153 start_codon:yes stop_codon:yes gene_type:complete
MEDVDHGTTAKAQLDLIIMNYFLFGILIIQIISVLSASIFGFRSPYMANH